MTIPGHCESVSIERYREMITSGAISWPSSAKRRPGASRTQGKAKRASPEEDLQRLCFEWVELNTPKHPVLNFLMHVPNGGARSKGEAGKLKAMGTKPGVPDFLLPRKNAQWNGLAIELKSDVGRLSDEQKRWLRALEEEGYLVSVCRSLEAFEALVKAYLQGGKAPECVEKSW